MISDDTYNVYIHKIKDIPILTAKDERLLLQEIRNGNIESKNKFVQSNLKLVIKIALQYKKYHHNLMDLIQEGNIGLIKAVEGYKSSYQTRFITYAYYKIKQSIRRYVMKKDLHADNNMCNIMMIEDHISTHPDDMVEKKQLQDYFARIFRSLPTRESLILQYRYNGKPLTFSKLGAIFDLSSESIRKIEGKLLKKIKSEHRDLKAFLRY